MEQAVQLFWEKGYEQTSINDLTKAMGIAAPSLYAAFGDKRSLFDEAVARYLATHKVPLRNITMMGTGIAEGEQKTRDERAQGRKVDVRVFVPEI